MNPDIIKQIHIGNLIKRRLAECPIDTQRICNFLKCKESDLQQMYLAASLDSDVLLRWSKLLEYDFFRIYTQHLIFYSPSAASGSNLREQEGSAMPTFRKNIYTKEMIDFFLELIQKGEKTKQEIVERYGIPKTTLYTWIRKYGSK